VELCRELHQRGAKFMVVGGVAIIRACYLRTTGDIDILIDTDLENEARVYKALATLPDGCVRELEASEVEKYTVVRVADEILVDLMGKASGIDYYKASQSLVIHEIDGVPIPFASPELLWRLKCRAGREKNAATSNASANISLPRASSHVRFDGAMAVSAVRIRDIFYSGIFF
jgi:hypothetical protein